jgi:hypothetical protein
MRMELWAASIGGRFYSKATNVSCWHEATFRCHAMACRLLGQQRTSGRLGA